MSIVNFSVPDDVKEAFNATLAGQNQNAVIADLMREAVQRAQARQQHVSAIDRILARRAQAPSVTEAQFQAARAGVESIEPLSQLIGKAKGCFEGAAAVDQFIRAGRDSDPDSTTSHRSSSAP